MGATSDIDRLIELGLSRYGAGDLDGALLMWEEALAIDPSNEQATSYVDYLRVHYDLLQGEPSVEDSEDAAFPIMEEPEYQIAVPPVEVAAAAASAPPPPAPKLEDLDAGWDMEETQEATPAMRLELDGEADDDPVAEPPSPASSGSMALELEADEPVPGEEPAPSASGPLPMATMDSVDVELDADEPPDFPDEDAPRSVPVAAVPASPLTLELSPDEPLVSARPEVNFEDATREYHGIAQRLSEPVIPKPGTASAGAVPAGDFSQAEATVGDAPRHDPSAADFMSEEHSGGFGPEGMQETHVRKRDLGFVRPVAATPAAAEASGEIELGHFDATQERASAYQDPRPGPRAETTELTLGPRAEEQTAEHVIKPSREDQTTELKISAREPESGEILLPPKRSTREMALPTRQPARLDTSALSQAEVVLTAAPTRELTPNEIRARAAGAPPADPMISAPTRELGLRPGGRPVAPGLSNPDDDNEIPTKQSDARAIRASATMAAQREPAPAPPPAPAPAPTSPRGAEGTRHDIVLPFDPIVARSAQILDEVDAEIPAGESKEEQTRRRITLLLERASQWADTGELDKAVAAADLALSEDPGSVLGQKLIARHSATIMSLFQSFLGDPERMPQLAKPLHELASAPISPRAAFLLSRIDGTLTLDELLDISGMPRLEAYRHLAQLYLRGVLR